MEQRPDASAAAADSHQAAAREIIERAMRDRSVYEQMAARESKVWGAVLPEWERSQAKAEDVAASAELGLAGIRPAWSKSRRTGG